MSKEVFVYYPIIDSATKQPFFDGECFLAEKHRFVVNGETTIHYNGVAEKIVRKTCVQIQPMKVKPDKENTYSKWGKIQHS